MRKFEYPPEYVKGAACIHYQNSSLIRAYNNAVNPVNNIAIAGELQKFDLDAWVNSQVRRACKWHELPQEVISLIKQEAVDCPVYLFEIHNNGGTNRATYGFFVTTSEYELLGIFPIARSQKGKDEFNRAIECICE